MRIIVDAMGGDNAPEEIVIGAMLGKRKAEVDMTLVGDSGKIRKILLENGFSPDEVTIEHTTETIGMADDPISILRTKKNSSMALALSLLRDEKGDAVLSAGSTGALIMASSSRSYKLKAENVRRCAIASVLPLKKPTLLLDSGANIEVTPEELYQFAVMGSKYMSGVFGIESPTVALINNGAEECKGTNLYVETYSLLSEKKNINFIGNVEGRDIPLGFCDVAVCDGFTGNIVLKLCEGMGKFISYSLKDIFSSNVLTKMGYLFEKKRITEFKESLSSEKYGGAPLLGTTKPVIKAHGSSNRTAIEAAVLQAKKYAESEIGTQIEEELKEVK